ncbi:caspase family protein [Flectobacillus longus]|uniref:caspase family protein n=1 Tax=Flectobacillus longus TaxID=2984207 RepID=UPI0024B756F2|nr:caspase family protein [Flectobacillus longus]MDI9878297.1 caspase family protein [Flectobacillus longus]
MLLKSILGCCFVSLLLVSQTFAQKSSKYAFIVQNTDFDDESWYNTGGLSYISKSGQTIGNLLKSQGFTNNNIVIKENVTSTEFRKAFNTFINSLPKGSICVVYLCSHGNKVHDNSGDEKIANPNQKDTDDEVFVCRDTPYDSKSINNRQQTDNKGTFDYSPHAIIDDEIGRFNEKILEKIGRDGHYLLLADFCYSNRSERGDNDSEDIILKDASHFVEANSLLFKGSLNTAPFIVMAASNQLMQVNASSNYISYFVAAVQYAFKAKYPLDRPSYLSFYHKFCEHLRYIKQGNPSIRLEPNSKVAQLPIFKGECAFSVENNNNGSKTIGIKSQQRGKEAIEDTLQEITFILEAPFLFEKGYTVTLFENKVKKAEGLVTKIEEDAIAIKFSQSIQAEKITSIHISERTKEAIRLFQKVQSREDIGAVLKLFHNPSLAVDVKDCINQYELLADHTIRLNNNNCLPSAAFKTLISLKDNISVSVKIPIGYYYNILDVTATNGVRSCYVTQDANASDTIPIFQYQQSNQYNEFDIFRSKITPPLGTSALWVVVSDVAFDGNYLKEYLFDSDPKQNTPLQEYQKYQLWEIIKHIRYFHEIKYTVVEK